MNKMALRQRLYIQEGPHKEALLAYANFISR